MMPFYERVYIPPEKDRLIREYAEAVKKSTGEEITKAKAVERLLDEKTIKEKTNSISKFK